MAQCQLRRYRASSLLCWNRRVLQQSNSGLFLMEFSLLELHSCERYELYMILCTTAPTCLQWKVLALVFHECRTRFLMKTQTSTITASSGVTESWAQSLIGRRKDSSSHETFGRTLEDCLTSQSSSVAQQNGRLKTRTSCVIGGFTTHSWALVSFSRGF